MHVAGGAAAGEPARLDRGRRRVGVIGHGRGVLIPAALLLALLPMAPAAGQEDQPADPPPVAAAQQGQDDQASDGAADTQEDKAAEGDHEPGASAGHGQGSGAAEGQPDSSGGDPDEGSGQDGESAPARPGGSSYGGRAAGPAPLETLPEDPAYPVPGPPKNDALPEEVDVAPAWQPNLVCDPVDRPGLEAFGTLVGGHYGRPGFTTSRPCIDQRSEHYDGRAVDWQLDAHDPHDRRIGDAAVSWLTADDGEMARRFGLQSVIWNHRVWHNDGRGWQHYVGQSPHTDHVHFSFTWDGAMMRTSWWTGVAVAEPDLGPCPVVAGQHAAIPQAPRLEPCPPASVAAPATGLGTVRPGGSGGGLGLLQPLLEVPATGELDQVTREALLRWQHEQGIPETGLLDQLTYAAALGEPLPEIPEAARAVPYAEHQRTAYTRHKRLRLAEGDRGPAVERLQEALGIEADGVFGPVTAEAVAELTAAHPLLLESEEVSTLAWHLLELRDHPTLPYRDIPLQHGDRGAAVAVLQRVLGVEADGIFGPVTEQAVREIQQEAGLEATGVVDPDTWIAMEQAAPLVSALAGDEESDGPGPARVPDEG